MPICPHCGKYHKKSHHHRHVKTCVKGTGYAYEHLAISRGASSMTKKIQSQKRSNKEERIRRWYGGE